MSHIWCHGPNCHTYATQDRVRGSKGNYFCSQGCYNDFANTFAQQIINIAPRTEPLETKIEDPKVTKVYSSYDNSYCYSTTTIKKIDESGNVG